jgi:hypothetical protein
VGFEYHPQFSPIEKAVRKLCGDINMINVFWRHQILTPHLSLENLKLNKRTINYPLYDRTRSVCGETALVVP